MAATSKAPTRDRWTVDSIPGRTYKILALAFLGIASS